LRGLLGLHHNLDCAAETHLEKENHMAKEKHSRPDTVDYVAKILKAKPDTHYADIVKAQSAAQPFAYPTGLIEVPMSPVSDVNAFRTHFWKLDWFLKAVRLAVEEAIRIGGVFDLLAHPSCLVVEDPSFETVKLICDLVKEAVMLKFISAPLTAKQLEELIQIPPPKK
jgi:hypothetical protein